MWDAWAAYDATAATYLHHERATAEDVEAARAEAISFAAYRVLKHRFASSPGATTTMAALDARMDALGYDKTNTSTTGDTPAALGNRIAAHVIAYGLADGSNEANGYANRFYQPVNPALIVILPGNPDILDPNRWQPLALQYYVDQNGNPVPTGYPPALTPEWGAVTSFALTTNDLTIHPGPPGFDWLVYHDPGPPPQIGGVGDATYKSGFAQNVLFSSYLTPDDGVSIDISPASLGNSSLGTNDGQGYALNPVTGQPYTPEVVPRGDYTRVLAEFFADGPSSETPPGHWFTIANYVSDQPGFEKRLGGTGAVLGDLEWDVKLYFALGGAVHDAAVTAWGIKGWYDSVRPISAIRYMADHGQSSDPGQLSYDPAGLPLTPGLIEVITPVLTAPGQKFQHLAGNEGKIAIRAWRGNPVDPVNQYSGVGWILAERWVPYQKATFVSPPFPGYVSGHSTYSRASAEVLTLFTGSEFFPSGLGEFVAPQNAYLTFERGPSVEVRLQWAKYFDAADQSGLSRIYGGIHPPFDDIPGRLLGHVIGPDAFAKAITYFNGTADDIFQADFDAGDCCQWTSTVPVVPCPAAR